MLQRSSLRPSSHVDKKSILIHLASHKHILRHGHIETQCEQQVHGWCLSLLPAITTVRSPDVPEQVSFSMTDVINDVPLGVRQ